MNHVVGIVFPQRVITIEDIAKTQWGIRDYEILDDGTLESSSFDSWIYLEYEPLGIVRPIFVTVNIEELEDQDPHYLMYFVGSYLFQTGEKTIGENVQSLRLRSVADTGLRFDFTTLEGQQIKIDSFIINDNQILTPHFREVWAQLGIYIVFLVVLISVGICKFGKDVYIVRCNNKNFWIGVLYFILGGLIAVGNFSMASELVIRIVGCVILGLLGWASILCRDEKNGTWCFFHKLSIRVLVILISFCVMDVGVHKFLFNYRLGEWENYFRNFMSFAMVLNFLFVIFIYSSLVCLTGFGIAGLTAGLFTVLMLIGNGIKIYYQQDLLTVADLYLMKEIIGISKQFLSPTLIAVIMFLTIALIFLAIYKRKSIFAMLHFTMHLRQSWILGCAFLFIMLLNGNAFARIGIDANKEYTQQRTAADEYGLGIYYFYMLTKGISSPVPDGYDASLVLQVEEYKNEILPETIQPNVILILAESLFQVDQLPGVEFNQDLFKNTRDYIKTTVISPSYGGRTAAAEFEALTGYTNYFIPGDIIAYTTYITNAKRETGGLAREFHDAGYRTIAMHPNRADYYNRNIVYESMGFDEFLDINAFNRDSSMILEDGFLKDEAFFDKMINVLENADSPVFIFGATIEGHSPYNNKYTSTVVQASSDLYSEGALTELSNYGQTVYDFDRQIGCLFEYLSESERPTLVYVFGDHLPPLEIYSDSNYLENMEVKYSTPLIVYSNYSDVNMDHTFSLSQLAPMIIKEAGIPHRAYFDFLYELGQKTPIIHKEFPLSNDEELSLYEKIQYDCLFGENYLIKHN